LLWNRQEDLGITELEKAVLLDPNSSLAYGTLAAGLNYSGRPEEAVGFVKQAMRLDPKFGPWVALWLGDSYYLLRRYDEAVAAYQEGVHRNPNYISVHRMLAATYAELGRQKEARAEVAEILRINPAYSVELYRARVPFKNRADLDRLIAGLRKAGLT
jgi:adenylate cyclase